ncbi:MAG: helix-turn-helix domain-containing protein [Verrucomicrobia bacterium]|nr:helix-turn-helix domain-containing protein [Verrucomicrobiota bacterium]
MATYTIPVLQKSIAVLRLIAEGGGNTTMKAMERTLGVPHSTMYRLVQTLVLEDWVRQVEGGRYELSFGLLPLLQPLVRHELLIETVREPMQMLSRETGLTTKLSVRQGHFDITIFRAESPRSASVHVKMGGAFPLVIGASGAVLLSSLADAARQRIIDAAPPECWKFQTRANVARRIRQVLRTGACADAGSYRPTIFAISAPLHDRSQSVIAAVTAIGFREDFAGEELRTHQKLVMETAARCSKLLQGAMPAVAEVAARRR